MAWHKLFVLGLVACGSAVIGCSVTATTGGSDGGTGGSTTATRDSGTGGATSTGGATGTGGEMGMGGNMAMGGADGGACRASPSPGTSGTCATCITTMCGAEWAACQCDPACNAGGEFACIQACLIAQVTDGGHAPSAEDCAGNCAVADGGGVVSTATSDLLACARAGSGTADAGLACQVDCFGGPI